MESLVTDPKELGDYDLIGFGSGIYSGKNHESLLELADSLPQADGKKAFLFSTDGTPRGLVKNEEMRCHLSLAPFLVY
ncbi:MAG TPA: hypothetical protein VN381_06500, partial [Anaerovoracaceae bacterium]|nr:hypothetical protein [Anaerovoracaceae bacterium]